MVVERLKSRLFYHRLPDDFAKDEKLDFLASKQKADVSWQRLNPNAKHTWLVSDTEAEFDSFLPIGSKQAKRASADKAETVFHTYSLGVSTNRDAWVYDFGLHSLRRRMEKFIRDYNTQVFLYSLEIASKAEADRPSVDDFVDYDLLAWSSTLKRRLASGQTAAFDGQLVRDTLYRPFTRKRLYYDRVLLDRPALFHFVFPDARAELENRAISIPNVGVRGQSYASIITNQIPNLNLSAIDGHQTFPFYTYDRDGGNRRENITDFALSRFREQYADPGISKWDIFHYVYALLHHPGYRARYALDLKRSLPRIPFAPEFHAFAEAGRQLADLHLYYETADRYSLEWDTGGKQIDFRVERMRPRNKRDSDAGDWKVFDSLQYNDTLTLRGIPQRAFAYRLGNRSALEWVVDQYRVKHDKRSGITHDANDYSDDARYIVDLLSRVITVSLKTLDVVDELAGLRFRPAE